MSLDIISENNNSIISGYNKFSTYFEQKEIGSYLDSFLSQKCDKIIQDINESLENGDIKNCNEIIRKINEGRIFRIFSKEKKIIFLDIIIKKILPNLVGSFSTILKFLTKIRFLIPKNYILDWKYFYSLYYILYNKYREEVKDYIPLFKNIHKHFSENSITKNDYLIIKKTFIEDLCNQNKSYPIANFIYFFPKKFIEDDYNLQYKLFLLLKNSKNNFIGSCCMFAKILKKNGKLFFCEEKEKNDEYINIFIKYYFTNLNLYIIDDPSIKSNNYISPICNEKKNKYDHSVIDLLIYLLFNTSLESYFNIILSNLKIILNNKHLYIKEKSNTSVAKNFIKFISDFVHRLFGNIFYKKKFEEEINKKIKYEIEYNKNNEYIFNKLLDIIKIFNTCFIKLFLYENEGTISCLEKLFNFLAKLKTNNLYIEKLKENINLKEYINIIKFFMENIETKSNKFIIKLKSIIPFLLSENIYNKDNEIKNLIKNIIILTTNMINSANINFDVNVLILFATNFLNDNLKKNKIYESLIPLIDEACIKILNNIIPFLDLICIKNNLEFSIFVNSMEHYLDENNKKIISRKYADYIQNYEIENKYLKFYFNVIDKNEHEYIFNYIYNNMIYIDKSNNTKINEFFLYPEIDEELNINNKYSSLEIFEKQIDKYRNIISLLDFSKILISEKNIKHFYQIYFTLMNKQETNFKFLGAILFKTVLNSLINSKIKEVNGNITIEYPSKENLLFIISIYKKIILPYEKYIKENLNNYNNNTKKFDQIILIYSMLIEIVTTTKLNIIILLLNEDNINNIGSEDIINLYKEYQLLISNSENIIKEIYLYKNCEILNKNQNINNNFDKIYINILKMNNDEMTNKAASLKNKKSYLFKYFDLRHLKNYWLKKKIKVMNYNYFSLLKNFISQKNFYYDILYLYSSNINAVNHPSNAIGIFKNFLYALNKEKIKEIYEKIYNEYKQDLTINKKEESETEQNKMKNILGIFTELCFVYINLFPKDIINVLIKLGNIFFLLRIRKSNKVENIIMILMKIKAMIYLPICSEKDLKYTIDKYSQRNNIIYNEFKKIKINEKILKENKIYYEIIRQIINFMLQIFNDENSILKLILINNISDDNKNNNIINEREKMFIISFFKDHILETLNKSEDLYKKIIKNIFETIISKIIPVSSKYVWMNILYIFIKDEYKSNKSYKYIHFKNEEEFNEKWKEIKYKLKGKDKNKILPIYVDNIRYPVYNFNKNENNYKINIIELLDILKQVDDWIEEKTLIDNDNNNIKGLFKKILQLKKENKGLEPKMIKLFYYMFELNYLDYNNDISIKNYKLIKDKNNKISPIIYEFFLGKYLYMMNNNLFEIKAKVEFLEILNYYSNGSNKNEDGKIISYFTYLFQFCSLEKILYVFNEVEFPFDFSVKLYNTYLIYFESLKPEKNIFDIKLTKDLINKIITNDSNIILYTNELKSLLRIYFIMNNYLWKDYSNFEEKYEKEKIINYFDKEFISNVFSKRSRYALYEIYSYFFNILNDGFSLFNLIIPKIALCVNEFKDDKGNNIITEIENKFKRFNSEINFEILCEKIAEILKNEENSNDANKLLYLQIVNIVYNSQKYFNFREKKSNSITENIFFKNLFKVFENIKNENLKIKFSSIFASFFNDLTEKENENFIKNYEELIKTNENYLYILLSQLLRFRMNLPLYIQEFIIKLKDISKKYKDKKSIIDTMVKIAMDNYHGSYIYMKNNISSKCKDILEEMTIEKSYFI